MIPCMAFTYIIAWQPIYFSPHEKYASVKKCSFDSFPNPILINFRALFPWMERRGAGDDKCDGSFEQLESTFEKKYQLLKQGVGVSDEKLLPF